MKKPPQIKLRTKNQLLYLKLSNGDDIVGDCLGEDEGHTMVFIKYPMLIAEVVNPLTQTLYLMLSKYMVFGKDAVIPIKTDQIIMMSFAMDEMKSFYNNSVVYHREIGEKTIIRELNKGNEQIVSYINDEREDFEEVLDTFSDDLVVPSNTNIH